MLRGSCHCGAVGWTLAGDPGRIKACNCTLCRRYGALWAYNYEGVHIGFVGSTGSYTRKGKEEPTLEVHFCAVCGCVVGWRGLQVGEGGGRRMAVNIRLAPPEDVAHFPVDHFDGLETFRDVRNSGKCVRDMWF